MPLISDTLNKAPQALSSCDLAAFPIKVKSFTTSPPLLEVRITSDGQAHSPLVCRILDHASIGSASVLTLENPVAVPRCSIHLIPPSQPDQSPPGNILEIVEIRGKE